MPITYRTLPVPAFDAYTLRIAAGVVTFGVEYRHLDEALILARYGPDARARFDNVMPAGFTGVVEEDGLSLHVFASADGAEHLRFDCFDEAAHYHLMDPTVPTNTVVEHEVAVRGPLLPWALEALRTRLPELLRESGAPALADAVDPRAVAAALPRVKAECERLLAVGRPVRVEPLLAGAPASPR
ncbi:hypothetical protein K2X89_15575 [Myxococcota bacterium]|nr:hypothetical protein [Myxococcota bacterium]